MGNSTQSVPPGRFGVKTDDQKIHLRLTNRLSRPSNKVVRVGKLTFREDGLTRMGENMITPGTPSSVADEIRSRLLAGQCAPAGWRARSVAALRQWLTSRSKHTTLDHPRTPVSTSRVTNPIDACRTGHDATDHLARTWIERADLDVEWAWPSEHRCGLVVTHDVDAPHRQAGIRRLCRVDERLGLKASYAMVGSWLGEYDRLCRKLSRAGHDIALHGLVHDRRLATWSSDEIAHDLRPQARDLRRLGIRGYRSPAWQVSTNLWCGLDQAGFLYDMSALDVWPFFEGGGLHGVGTFLPFLVGDLVVLPTTVPLELPWAMGWDVHDTLPFWRDKIDHIARQGGLLMISSSPEAWLSGNRQAASAYEGLLRYVLETHNPACMTACEASLHVKTQVIRGAMVDVPGSPRLRIPCVREAARPRREQPAGIRRPVDRTAPTQTAAYLHHASTSQDAAPTS